MWAVINQRNKASQKRYSSDFCKWIKAGYLLKIRDKKLDMDIDIMVNKASEQYNSALVKEYAKLDPRFRKVMLYLKSWNK